MVQVLHHCHQFLPTVINLSPLSPTCPHMSANSFFEFLPRLSSLIVRVCLCALPSTRVWPDSVCVRFCGAILGKFGERLLGTLVRYFWEVKWGIFGIIWLDWSYYALFLIICFYCIKIYFLLFSYTVDRWNTRVTQWLAILQCWWILLTINGWSSYRLFIDIYFSRPNEQPNVTGRYTT